MARVRSSRMIGRAQDLADLRASAERAAADGCACVLVTGEAGLGKTRLVTTLVEQLRAEGWLVLVSHGVDLEGGEVPYSLVAELLRDLLRQRGTEATRAVCGELAASLAGLVPVLGDGGPVPPVDRATVISSLLTLLDRLAAGTPVCWLVEDLQWADQVSRDLVRYAGRALTASPVLLLGTVRTRADGELPEHLEVLEEDAAVEVVRLRRLDREALLELAEDLLGDSAERPDLVDRVVRLSDGLPFFAEELARTDTGSLPRSLRRLVARGTRTVAGPTQRLLEAAAVGQPRLDPALLSAVTGMDSRAVGEALTEAVRAGVLDVGGPPKRYRFAHALLSETIMEEIDGHRLADLHRAWAEVLERVTGPDRGPADTLAVARHWVATGDACPALRWSVAAARAAAALDAGGDALSHWERAFQLFDECPDGLEGDLTWEDLAVRLCHGASFILAPTATMQLVDRVARSPRSRTRLGGLYVASMRALGSRIYDLTLGLPVPPEELDETVAWLLTLEPTVMAWHVLHSLLHLYEDDRPDLSAPIHDVLEEWAAALGGPDPHMAIENHRHRAWEAEANGDEEAMLAAYRAEFDAVRESTLSMRAYAAADLVYGLAATGRHDEAAMLARTLLAESGGHAAVVSHLWSRLQNVLCWSLLENGRWDQAAELAEDLRRHCPVRWMRTIASCTLNRIARRRGDRAAISDLDLAALVEEIDPEAVEHDYSSLWLWTLLGVESAAARRDTAGVMAVAGRFFATAMWSLDQIGAGDVLLLAARALTWNEVPDAGHPELVRRWLGLVHPLGLKGQAWSGEVRALVARVDGSDVAEEWERVVGLWDRAQQVYDAALARVRYAEALLRDGRTHDAAPVLQQALATARQLGAAPLAEGIGRIAVAHGIRLAGCETAPGESVAGRDGTQLDVLTARERDVLALVALGRTNDQIAAELFMSPKTASVHVSRILAKLGLSNRTEAAALAHRAGAVATE